MTWELAGEIKDLSIDFRTGAAVLSVAVDSRQDACDAFDELNGKKVSVRIGKYRQKRSLDANAYFWVLADKLAAVTGVRKEDIYRREIRYIGGNTEVVCVKETAAEKLCRGWERNGLGWVTDVVPSKLDGCVNVILYYGSSTYETAQMSRLIELIVDECKEAGVQVMTPDEIADMLSKWEDYEKHHTKG